MIWPDTSTKTSGLRYGLGLPNPTYRSEVRGQLNRLGRVKLKILTVTQVLNIFKMPRTSENTCTNNLTM